MNAYERTVETYVRKLAQCAANQGNPWAPGQEAVAIDLLLNVKACQNPTCGWPFYVSHITRIRVIDHCHESGLVRRLLCRGCNIAYGAIRECPDRLRGLLLLVEQDAA